jgi:hypothetical protein
MWTVVVRLVWGRIVLPHRDGVVWCFVDRLEEWEIRLWGPSVAEGGYTIGILRSFSNYLGDYSQYWSRRNVESHGVTHLCDCTIRGEKTR